MVIRPERWPSRSCLSSKLTPADLSLLPNVCLRSWTHTCSRLADFLVRIHAVFGVRVMGVLLYVKTCLAFSPRCLLTGSFAMVLRTASLSSPYFTYSLGMINTAVLSAGTETFQLHRKLQISPSRHLAISPSRQPVLTANRAVLKDGLVGRRRD